MNTELMFDLACSVANGRRNQLDKNTISKFKIGKDTHELTLVKQEKLLSRGIQAFMHTPSMNLSSTSSMQAFAGSSDLPKLTKSVFNVTNYTLDYDLGWQKVFKGVKLGKGELSWEIAAVEAGISFKLIPEGGKVEYGDIAGEVHTAKIEKYGAGLGVTWETIQGRKLYKFVEIMTAARTALYDLWAEIHYGLIAAASTSNQITWQGVVADRDIDRDIETISAGANALKVLNKDKGYGNMSSARLVIYCQDALKSRINQALSATASEMKIADGNGQIVDSNVTPSYTFNSAVKANKGLLVLPGNKIQNAVYLSELGYSREEIESLNELRTYWTAFGAVIADTDQVFELSFS